MFPSANFNNPFDQPSLLKPSSFTSDQNPSSKQDDPPFLFHFPSPFYDEHESPLNQIFFQNHQMAKDQTDMNTDLTKKDATKRSGNSKLDEKEADQENTSGTVAPLRRRNLGVIPRRRTGKKDRHSKICTAQGIRDRRMRLSLQVARKFFDLQDMLGYDKASKTIEWLFNKSKKAIKELINDQPQANNISTSTDARTESFLSECEVVSGIAENTSNKDVKESIVPAVNLPLNINPCGRDERTTQKPANKPNTNGSREKARERARCRTREKMIFKRLEYACQWYKPNPTPDNENILQLGSSHSCTFQGVDQESNSNNQERISPYEDAYNSLEQHLADVGTIEKILGNSSSSASCPISDYHCSAPVSGYTDLYSNFMGHFGNWDLLNNDRANSLHDSVSNQVSLAGNPSSVYSVSAEFP